MDQRQDAMLAAAKFTVAVNEAIRKSQEMMNEEMKKITGRTRKAGATDETQMKHG